MDSAFKLLVFLILRSHRFLHIFLRKGYVLSSEIALKKSIIIIIEAATLKYLFEIYFCFCKFIFKRYSIEKYCSYNACRNKCKLSLVLVIKYIIFYVLHFQNFAISVDF